MRLKVAGTPQSERARSTHGKGEANIRKIAAFRLKQVREEDARWMYRKDR
jgi:hypothetical protein